MPTMHAHTGNNNYAAGVVEKCRKRHQSFSAPDIGDEKKMGGRSPVCVQVVGICQRTRAILQKIPSTIIRQTSVQTKYPLQGQLRLNLQEQQSYFRGALSHTSVPFPTILPHLPPLSAHKHKTVGQLYRGNATTTLTTNRSCGCSTPVTRRHPGRSRRLPLVAPQRRWRGCGGTRFSRAAAAERLGILQPQVQRWWSSNGRRQHRPVQPSSSACFFFGGGGGGRGDERRGLEKKKTRAESKRANNKQMKREKQKFRGTRM